MLVERRIDGRREHGHVGMLGDKRLDPRREASRQMTVIVARPADLTRSTTLIREPPVASIGSQTTIRVPTELPGDGVEVDLGLQRLLVAAHADVADPGDGEGLLEGGHQAETGARGSG